MRCGRLVIGYLYRDVKGWFVRAPSEYMGNIRMFIALWVAPDKNSIMFLRSLSNDTHLPKSVYSCKILLLAKKTHQKVPISCTFLTAHWNPVISTALDSFISCKGTSPYTYVTDSGEWLNKQTKKFCTVLPEPKWLFELVKKKTGFQLHFPSVHLQGLNASVLPGLEASQ